LKPNGQFGTRRCGGKDAASPRYIFTELSDVTTKIFRKEDFGILKYLNDDGFDIEPEYYIPIIPMVLVNGAIGIGTGFSTNVPCYNPIDIVSALKEVIATGNTESELIPWAKGYTGTISKVSPGKYSSKGKIGRVTKTQIEVTELPIGVWTQDFKELLEEYLDANSALIKSYDNNYTETKVSFLINCVSSAACDSLMEIDKDGTTKIENDLKLISKSISTSNMYLFNSKGQIQKYGSPEDILKDFYEIRLEFYLKRKEKLLKDINEDISILENKVQFIRSVVSEDLRIQNFTKAKIIEYLESNKFMKVEDSFDYLLRLPIYNLTKDKVEELVGSLEQKKLEYTRIEKLCVKEWWTTELDEFLEAYKRRVDSATENLEVETESPKKKRK
jgi:DNA topoisomerase-2